MLFIFAARSSNLRWTRNDWIARDRRCTSIGNTRLCGTQWYRHCRLARCVINALHRVYPRGGKFLAYIPLIALQDTEGAGGTGCQLACNIAANLSLGKLARLSRSRGHSPNAVSRLEKHFQVARFSSNLSRDSFLHDRFLSGMSQDPNVESHFFYLKWGINIISEMGFFSKMLVDDSTASYED